ncbi:DNA primase [Bacillus phage Belinda]|uniref:transposase n=1 Tax=Bacillus phage Belinda TaxID=1852564 RepID=UPI0007F06F09|nr:transposase [Bacillus phage Belinda]ANM46057.1 DNA primase [Bacillus phage Belinda]
MFMDFVEQELGIGVPANGEMRFNCPFCGNDKHKFYVETNPRGLWQCKRCGESGNPISFVMKLYEVTYKASREILEGYDYDPEEYRKGNMSHSRYGADLTEEEQLLLFIANRGQDIDTGIKPDVKKKCPRPPTNCKRLLDNFNNPEAYPFLQYLHGRGVSLEQIKNCDAHYTLEGTVYLENEKTLTLRNSLVFFTFNSAGKPVYWNTRSIDKDAYIKSFNATARDWEYSRKDVVMGLDRVGDNHKIIIVEGFFNMTTLGDGAVVTFGKQVTNDQIDLILNSTQKWKQPIYLYLDRDAKLEMIRTANLIREKEPDREVYFVYSPDDKDANDLGFQDAWARVNNAIKADAEGILKLELLYM